MKFLRRFFLTGVAVTALDIGLVLICVNRGLSFAVSDLIAVVTATVASYFLHQAISYAAEPSRRWYRDVPHYLLAVVLALGIDVGVFVFLADRLDGMGGTVVAKVCSLTAAFLVRLWFYRQVMFLTIREEQGVPQNRPQPPGDLRLSLVVPAYFEEEGIAATVERVEQALGHLREDGGFELVIVDDGSTDATAQRAREAGADQVIAMPVNRGKGSAVRAGMLAARGRVVAFTDADLSYAPEQVLGLLEQVERGWDVVVGSRKHDGTRTLVEARRLREIGGRVINVFTSLVLLGYYRDTQCGLKAFRSDVATVVFSRSQIDGFAFDVEVFHLVERYRFSLLEVPVELTNSARSTVRVARDASRLVRDLFRIRAAAHSGAYELEGGVPATLTIPIASK
jgi:putative flippase GtrA